LGRVGENGIQNGSKIRIIRKKQENEKSEIYVCQNGTTVRVFTCFGSTTMRPVGTAVPAPMCPETPIFHFLRVF